MPRPKIHDDQLRVRLLDRAGELLSAEGPHALNLRRLAADVGTSTTAVYTLFGGKPALLRALYREAFDRLGERLAAVPRTEDLTHDLLRLAWAYRECALADPQLYSIMFTRSIPRATPPERAIVESTATINPLRDRILTAVDEGMSLAAPAEVVAICLWATMHGLLSLELTGRVPPELDVERHFDEAVRAAIRGWLPTS